MKITTRLIISMISVLYVVITPAWAGNIVYVDDNAPLGGDGLSWATAYRFLQDGLNSAAAGVGHVEIRVGQGVYRPNQGQVPKRDERMLSFHVRTGMALKGGYAGLDMLDPNERDINTYETILSGDLAGDDGFVVDPCDLGTESTREDNSFHVVSCIGVDANTLLSGFVISGGQAKGSGGGMVIDSADVRIESCTFLGNYASSAGGGVECTKADCVFVGCQFIQNAAAIGGGVNSTASLWDGHINRVKGSPVFDGCLFRENYAQVRGGGLNNEYGSPVFDHCLWIANVAAERAGGGLFNRGYFSSQPQLYNCTFAQNLAPVGRAFACGGREGGSNPKLTNCILWEQDSPVSYDDGSSIQMTYSNVHGGWHGNGNINQDPCFVDPANYDFHLKSQAGRWDSNEAAWMQDEVTSSCIDAGDPNAPIMYEPFPNGGRINMGAYGGTVEASKSWFGKPVCETIVAGDINGDCKVDFEDLVILMRHWTEE